MTLNIFSNLTDSTILLGLVLLSAEAWKERHYPDSWGKKSRLGSWLEVKTLGSLPAEKACYEILLRAGFTHIISCCALSKQTNMDHPYIHLGRESPTARHFLRCDSHLALHRQTVLSRVTWTAGAAFAFFTKEHPCWQPDVVLTIGNKQSGTNYSKISF